MSGPKIFVAGPSARPNIGSPAQYLQQIQRVGEQVQNDKYRKEKLAQDKLFSDRSYALDERKVDWTEGAREREIAEEQRLLSKDNEKYQLVNNVAQGAQFMGAGDWQNTVQKDLMKDPRFRRLDEQGQMQAMNEYILKNPEVVTTPQEFANQMRSVLTNAGLHTGAEIETAIQEQVAKRYPTMSVDTAEKLFVKGKDLIPTGRNGNNVSLQFGNDGRILGTTGRSTKQQLIYDPTNPTLRDDIVARIAAEEELSKDANYYPELLPFVGGERMEIEGGGLNVTQNDVSEIVGALMSTGEIANPGAIQSVLVQKIQNGVLPEAYDWRTEAGMQRLLNEAKLAQAGEESTYNTSTGQRGSLGDVNSQLAANGQLFGAVDPVDAANAALKTNMEILSKTVPRTYDDDEVVALFLDGLGGTKPVTTGQLKSGAPVTGGGQVPSPAAEQTVPSPTVQTAPPAPTSIGTGEDRILTRPPVITEEQAVQRSGTPQMNTIGGPEATEAALSKAMNEDNFYLPKYSPQALALKEGRKVFNAAEGLLKGLTPAKGDPILSNTEKKDAQKVAAELIRDNMSTSEFMATLSPADKALYRKATDPSTPIDEAAQILAKLRKKTGG